MRCNIKSSSKNAINIQSNEPLFAISYHLYKFKNVKNTHGGVLFLVKLQAEAYNFTESNTPPWVLFKFHKLPNRGKHHMLFPKGQISSSSSQAIR